MNYIAPEHLVGENQYYSDTHGLVDAQKRIQFQSLPPILIFHLKRFTYSNGAMTKVLDSFTFTEELSMDPFMANNCSPYTLMGVLSHTGETL